MGGLQRGDLGLKKYMITTWKDPSGGCMENGGQWAAWGAVPGAGVARGLQLPLWQERRSAPRPGEGAAIP